MEKRLLKKNQDIEIRISDMAFGGVGIGKLQTEKGDFAVFVQNTIPGQLVSARVEKCDKRYAVCKLLDVLEPSPDEVETPFQPIPGAPYATLPIALPSQAILATRCFPPPRYASSTARARACRDW